MNRNMSEVNYKLVHNRSLEWHVTLKKRFKESMHVTTENHSITYYLYESTHKNTMKILNNQ